MEQVTITLTEQQIYDEVDKLTSMLGAKSALYDEYRTQTEDREWLVRHLNEACSNLCDAVGRYLHNYIVDNGARTFALLMPSRYDTNRNSAVEAQVLSYIVNYIISKYDMVAKQDQVDVYAKIATSHLGAVVSLLSKRKPPIR